jgi:signal peptidase II
VTEKQRIWIVPAAMAATTIVLDQLSKLWILRALGPEPGARAIDIVEPWVRLVYTQNTGVAFSLFRNASNLFIPIALLICAGAVYYYATQLPNRRLPVQLALGLVLGGAVGNLIDRVRLGFVVDFVQVGRFPVFNVADSAITVGTALLLVVLVFFEGHDRPSLETHGA